MNRLIREDEFTGNKPSILNPHGLATIGVSWNIKKKIENEKITQIYMCMIVILFCFVIDQNSDKQVLKFHIIKVFVMQTHNEAAML